MVVPSRSVSSASATPVEALLELSRSAGEDSLPAIVATVAQTLRDVAGYRAVVVNLYRPAWDDYEVVLVLGSPESQETLMGTRAPSESWNRLFSCERQPLPGVFLLDEHSTFWDGVQDIYEPDLPPSDDPDAWHSNDGLMVSLREPGGVPIAFLSLDEPESGKRPTEAELRLIRAICSHAEQGLCSARRSERATENGRMLSQLMAASPALAGAATTELLVETACDMVVPQLGFERIAVYARRDDGPLWLTATRGWDDSPGPGRRLDAAAVEAVIADRREHAGCRLIDAGELFGVRGVGRSRRNGRGLSAWQDHALILPVRGEGTRLRALVVIEDPADHLVPTDERRRAVRLLIDQVIAAHTALEQREALSHLASHDPLTGVRNRRGLTDVLRHHADAALLVCDLDHFKRINDRYGHDVGDRVLQRFGQLLRELSRDHDVPMRLGGEEFCLVLPATDRAGALRAAERLRTETSARMGDLIPEPVTVSVGVATNPEGGLDPHRLLRRADRGLYAAKRGGRNRSVEGDG